MDHPVKRADMSELAEYQEHLRRKPQLRYLFFELTDRCNMRCLHCGSSCSGSGTAFLDLKVVERVLRSVSDSLPPLDRMVCLTGGEPALHPGICTVINLSRDAGFSVGMTTNGTLIDPMLAHRLAFSGLDTVAVSLDGIGPIHDSFRRSEGAFERALQGIWSLRSAGLEPQVITVAHRKNIDHLDEIYRFLRQFDIYSWRIVNLEPIGRALDHPELLLGPHEMRRLLSFIREKRYDPQNEMEVTYGCSHFLSYEYEKEVRDYYFQCGAGIQAASVLANGDIVACLDVERREDLIQGNAYTDDFASVWETRFQIFREDRSLKSDTCRRCGYQDACMGDSAHTWNYDTNEPAYCVAGMLREGMP